MDSLSKMQTSEPVPIVRYIEKSGGARNNDLLETGDNFVRKDGRVNAEDLVPGDVMFLSSGMRIPAD